MKFGHKKFSPKLVQNQFLVCLSNIGSASSPKIAAKYFFLQFSLAHLVEQRKNFGRRLMDSQNNGFTLHTCKKSAQMLNFFVNYTNAHLQSFFSTIMTLKAMKLSKPLVGSSQSIRWGSVSASDAKERRLRSPEIEESRFYDKIKHPTLNSPPDSPLVLPGTPIMVWAHFFRLNSLITASTRANFCL